MSAEVFLRGQVAWVVGASGDIGQAVVRALAAAGAHVFASSRRRESLAALARTPDDPGEGCIEAMPVDVTDTGSVTAAARGIVAAAGKIDILVNTTTLPIFGPFEQLDDAQWSAVLDTKLMGYMRTLRAMLPLMAAWDYGRIVNITGRGGRQPSATHLPGSCANAAVKLLSKGLADAYGANNIRINAVAPGPIRSDRLRRLLDTVGPVGEPGAGGQIRLTTPIPRQGTPQDVAVAVLYLVSQRSDYITGSVLQVDGGGTAAL